MIRYLRKSLYNITLRNVESGFSMVEMLVGLVILTVGIVGFSGMLLMQFKMSRFARKTDETATLVQTTIEDFSGICFDHLGSDTTSPSTNGLDNAVILTDGPLNRNGEASGTGSGPYIFDRHVVICGDTDTGTSAGASPDPCAETMTDSTRPQELACDNIVPALTNREKLVRVLVSWTDSTGVCHVKTTDSLAFDWDGSATACP